MDIRILHLRLLQRLYTRIHTRTLIHRRLSIYRIRIPHPIHRSIVLIIRMLQQSQTRTNHIHTPMNRSLTHTHIHTLRRPLSPIHIRMTICPIIDLNQCQSVVPLEDQ